MSKVPYEINVNRYVCAELERIRDMIKTMDFSGLAATVERIQWHVSAMEDGLYSQRTVIQALKQIDDAKVSDEKFRKKVRKAIRDLSEQNPWVAKKFEQDEDDDSEE